MSNRKFMHILSYHYPRVGNCFGRNKIVEITKVISGKDGIRFSCWVEPLKENE